MRRLAEGILIVCACAAAVAAQGAAKTTWDGVYTDAQARRGEAAYQKSCATCHAPDLSGVDGPSLTGPEFVKGWTDLTLDDLFERARTTMPAETPGSLARDVYADIVALILSKAGFPAGAADLPSDNTALKQIKFVAVKP